MARRRAQPMATLGFKLLRACINEESSRSLRGLSSEWFKDGGEREAFEFLLSHEAEHNTLPGLQTFASQGWPLPEVDDAASFYSHKLRERYIYQQFTEAYSQVGQLIQSKDVEGAVGRIRELAGLGSILESDLEMSNLSTEVQEVVANYQHARDFPGLQGIPFGFPSLDEATLGALPGDLITFAGRTGVGKTYKLASCLHHAWEQGHRCLAVTMEMNRVPFIRRLVGIHSGINPNLIRSGALDHMGETQLMSAAEEMIGAGQTMSVIGGDFEKSVAGIRTIIEDGDYDAVYIDAAYLLTPEGRNLGYLKTYEVMSKVVGQLKKIALKKAIPIIQTVQLNRNVKKTSQNVDTRDVSGSDSVGHDTSVLCALRLPPPPANIDRRICDIIKNREGFEPSYFYSYEFEPVRIEEVEEEAPEEEEHSLPFDQL